MKTASDPRHIARIKTMQALFAYDFHDKKEHKDKNVSSVVKHIKKIDKLIAKSAPAFPVDKIAKVDLAVLRLAVYELTVSKKAPPKVVIDEAVEMAKEFGGDSSSAFVNGVLGSVLEKGESYGNKNH